MLTSFSFLFNRFIKKLVLFIFLCAVFSGCAKMLTPESSEGTNLQSYNKTSYLESIGNDSKVILVGYQIRGDFIMLVIKCSNTAKQEVDVFPKSITAVGFTSGGDSLSLKVDASSQMLNSQFLVNVFDKNSRILEKMIPDHTLVENEPEDTDLNLLLSNTPQSYVEVQKDTTIDRITLYRGQYIMGAVSVTLSCSDITTFRIDIPIGSFTHHFYFKG